MSSVAAIRVEGVMGLLMKREMQTELNDLRHKPEQHERYRTSAAEAWRMQNEDRNDGSVLQSPAKWNSIHEPSTGAAHLITSLRLVEELCDIPTH